jgi:ribosomal peptide maturation radical SAM protein 1
MRTVLVQLPWGAIDTPSLALGILRTVAADHGHEVLVRYANLDFVDWIAERHPFTAADYRYYAEASYFQSAGDWVFAGALNDGEVRPGADRHFLDFLADTGATPAELATTRAVHDLAAGFVDELAAELVALEPDLVGFTTTFQQNTAALATAKALHRLRPGLPVVFGGANCDGAQGAALHRNFPFVDLVVRGEAELAFPALLAALESGGDLSGIGGLCWRDADGRSHANPQPATPLPPASIRPPDYTGFFERVDASVAAGWVSPKLIVEGSRGCWWGAKHHCTFCGLNGTSMEYRSKPPEAFVAEVLGLAERHQLLDFYVVDNILDMGYFGTALPALAAAGHDLRLHFEVKANLRRRQFTELAAAGVVQVQPGIENLNTHVLRLMDKGVTGAQNVRALRDAQSAGVAASWNYLFGFPGETDADYTSVLSQFPALHHLEPPIGATRIVLERFSPYFDRPELGFAEREPSPQYRDLYRLPEAELNDLAYAFATPPRGIGRELADALTAAVDEWTARFPDSRLDVTDLGERIVLVNRRAGFDWTVLELTDPVELALFRLLDAPRTLRVLTELVDGGADTVQPLLSRWTELGILFCDNGSWLHVAVGAANQGLLRVDHDHRADHAPVEDSRAVALD